MILARDLLLSLGHKTLFDNLSFSFALDQKIGFVGRNGAGKSTLLKVLAGFQTLDEGTINIEKGCRIGYLPQDVVLNSQKSILDEAFSAFDTVISLEQKRFDLEQEIDAGSATALTLEHYAHLLEELKSYDLDNLKVKTQTILAGLGFPQQRWSEPASNLSTGWKMRLVLAKLLLQEPDFYLFDEPTNHLDIVAKDWFLEFLKQSNTGFLLVSHDRFFLDHACDYIYELDRGTGKLYTGNYDKYLTEKENADALQEKAYLAQQREIKEKKATIERFRAKASKAKMAQSMLKSLEKIELIKAPDSGPPTMSFNFSHVPRAGKIILTVDNVSKSFEGRKIFENATFDIERGEKVALVAANGVGKTTLLSILTEKIASDTGEIVFGHNVIPAMFEQEQDKVLNKQNTVLKEVEDSCTTSEARQQVRRFLGGFLFPGDDVHKKIGVLSGGEKNRVAMIKVLLAQANFLILDEPTNHLDLDSKKILLSALQQFSGTILFVSHDRTFLDDLATSVIELTPNGTKLYKGNYEDFLYYKSLNEQPTGTQIQTKTPPQPRTVIQEKKKPKISGKRAYELGKKNNSLEKKISRLEQELITLDKEFAALEYSSDRYLEQQEKIQDTKKKLKDTMTEWELVQKELF